MTAFIPETLEQFLQTDNWRAELLRPFVQRHRQDHEVIDALTRCFEAGQSIGVSRAQELIDQYIASTSTAMKPKGEPTC